MFFLLASLALFILFIVLGARFLKKAGKLRTEFVHPAKDAPYIENPLIEEKNLVGNFNRVFENQADSSRFIDKYMISYESGAPFLLCHLDAPLKSVETLEFVGYDCNKKAVYTLYVTNVEAFTESPVIKLPKQVVDVNIHAHEKGDPLFDTERFYASRAKAYRKLAKHASVILFFLLAPLSYLLLSQMAEYETIRYMNFETLSLGFALITLTCLVHYLCIALWVALKSRTRGEMNG
ncbi:MAG: hypothetical protein ACOCSM_00590 [Bacillota bacterium]